MPLLLALRTYQAELLPELARYGARLVAISPQSPDQVAQHEREGRTELFLTVLSDPGAALAYRLGIGYTPTPEVLRAQRALGLDLTKVNATVDLPLPTVLIIDSDRTVRFVDPSADYTQRTEVRAILGALERLGDAGVPLSGYQRWRAVSEQPGHVKVERGNKRVRVYLGGELVADTISPLLVWEVSYYPTYYFPATGVRAELLDEGAAAVHSLSRGDAAALTAAAGASRGPGAAVRYEDSPIQELRGAVRLQWDAMEAWFRRSRRRRRSTRTRGTHHPCRHTPSSRRMRVCVDGLEIADSSSPRLLFETGLPVRYYLPRTHVRMDLLELSPTVTHCPYKGRAQTWSLRVGATLHEDLAWSYPSPLPESQKIAGLIAFYNALDIEVDGELPARPYTKFS